MSLPWHISGLNLCSAGLVARNELFSCNVGKVEVMSLIISYPFNIGRGWTRKAVHP